MIRRLPYPVPGGGVIVHLRWDPLVRGMDQYYLPSAPFSDQGILVGPEALISRAYVEGLRKQGWEGTEDIPLAFISDP